MNTKDNQRSRLTKMLMKQAYLRLMHEHQTGSITVKEICSVAEINRSTFYLHYSQPNDILMELEDESIADISIFLRSIGSFDEADTDAEKILLSFLRRIREKRDVLHTLLVINGDPHFRRKLFDLTMELSENVFNLSLPAPARVPVFRFIVSGSLDMLTEWLRNDCAAPESELSHLLFSLCKGCLNSYLSSTA